MSRDIKFVSDSEDDSIAEDNTSVKIHNVTINESIGDLFDAPDKCILVHACNCMGTWGAGIALQFAQRYPEAYIAYKRYCEFKKETGTCLLVPSSRNNTNKHYIACLFTSYKYGTYRDSPEDIVQNTKRAVKDLLSQIKRRGIIDYNIRMPKINSKNFNVPWNNTKDIIESINVDRNIIINVIDLC